jgi:hypothetical protein
MFLPLFYNYAISIKHESICPFLLLLKQAKWSESFIKVGHFCTCQFVNVQWSVKVAGNSQLRYGVSYSSFPDSALSFTCHSHFPSLNSCTLYVNKGKIQKSSNLWHRDVHTKIHNIPLRGSKVIVGGHTSMMMKTSFLYVMREAWYEVSSIEY